MSIQTGHGGALDPVVSLVSLFIPARVEARVSSGSDWIRDDYCLFDVINTNTLYSRHLCRSRSEKGVMHFGNMVIGLCWFRIG